MDILGLYKSHTSVRFHFFLYHNAAYYGTPICECMGCWQYNKIRGGACVCHAIIESIASVHALAIAISNGTCLRALDQLHHSKLRSHNLTSLP